MINSKIIAHRFGAGLGPESTQSALMASVALGVRWVEFDASLLKDGTVIVFHDDTFDRCTDQTGPLNQTNWERVQHMDAGRWFGEQFQGEKILELGQALTILDKTNVNINLEIKVNQSEQVELVEAVLALTSTKWPRQDDLIFSSFSHEALRHLRKREPHAHIAHLFDTLPTNWREQAEIVSARNIHLDADKISDEDIKMVKQAGYSLFTYTVNDMEVAKKLIALGVDGVFSDFPDRFPASWISD